MWGTRRDDGMHRNAGEHLSGDTHEAGGGLPEGWWAQQLVPSRCLGNCGGHWQDPEWGLGKDSGTYGEVGSGHGLGPMEGVFGNKLI